MGFDEIRVRCRQQRRDIIRHVILNKLSGTSLKEYISTETRKLIRKEDQDSFFEDVIEDLRYIDLSRIAILDVTPDQMYAWILAQLDLTFS